MRPTDSPVVVVGAGIIGLSTALHLRRSTDRPIVVLDAGAVGDGTTPAGAGFVAPWATVLPHLGTAGLQLADYSLDFYGQIAASGADISYRRNGNIVLFNSRPSLETALPAMTGSPTYGTENRLVDAAEVAELTGGIVDATQVAGGVLMPRGIQLETGLVLAHLAEQARDDGVQVREHTEVRSVVVTDGRVQGVRVADALGTADLDTDCLVLAVGAWLNELLAPLGWRLPLLPFVATRFVTEDVGVPDDMPTMQAKDFPLWIRGSEGGFTWGTTVGAIPAHRLGDGWTGFDPQTRHREELVTAMSADVPRVAKVFPRLAGAKVIRVLQGMPVYTVDRQFFVGEVPGNAGVWAVGGDNESGVSHGPGLGRLLADLVTGAERPLCDASAWRLDRFDPAAYADEEAVGQAFVDAGPNWIADSMRATSLA